MWLDISLGAVALATALLGVIVTLYPQLTEKYKVYFLAAFVVLAIIGFVLIAIQSRNRQQEQSAANASIAGLQSQLRRAMLPIRDVLVTFSLKIPLDHPALESYKHRLERCVEKMLASGTEECGALSTEINTETNRFIIGPHSQICLRPNTEIYPRQSTEWAAYSLMTFLRIDFGVFKHDLKDLTNSKPPSDLSFRITKRLDDAGNVKERNYPYVELCYSIPERTLRLHGTMVPPDPDQWRTTERVNAIPDLQDTYLLVNLQLSNVDLNRKDESAIAQTLARQVVLEGIKLSMSNGKEFRFSQDVFTAGRDQRGFPSFYAPIK